MNQITKIEKDTYASTKTSILNWSVEAQKGDRYIYAHNAAYATQGREYREAWALHEKGRVVLVQKRTSHKGAGDGKGTFDYIAIRTGEGIGRGAA